MSKRQRAIWCCCAFLAMGMIASPAQADLMPFNSKAIKHKITLHNTKAFSQYTFVVVGLAYTWQGPKVLKEGSAFPYFKVGGAIFAVPKAKWKKLGAASAKTQRSYTVAKFKRMGFAKARSIYAGRYVTKPTKVHKRHTRLTIKSIKAGVIQLQIQRLDFDKAGKRLKAKTKKGKKTSMLEQQSTTRLAALPFGVVLIGVLMLLLGSRRRRAETT